MAKLLQLRGGTTSQHSSFTGAVREVTVDTDKDVLVVHDGSTAGGFPAHRDLKGSEIASADPLVITAGSNYYIVTGTTGFNDMTVAANHHFFLEFASALVMTHVGGALALPSGAAITTAAGDVGEFFATAANVVTCVSYTKASGKPVKTDFANADINASAAIVTSKLSGAVTSIASHGLGALASLATVGNSQIDNNAVDEDKLKDALVGDFTDATVTASDYILHGDATDSGNTKKDTVQGILDLVPASGGAWNLINTAVASNSASLTITGLDSTYDTYAIAWSDMVPATNEVALELRMGDASGIDDSAGDYTWHCERLGESTTVNTYSASSSTSAEEINLGSRATGNSAGRGNGGLIYLSRPGDGTMHPTISGTYSSLNGTGLLGGGHVIGQRKAVITLDRVQVLFASGNVASGRLTVWGISHT